MPEKVIETKICKHCQASFDITDKDEDFYRKLAPTIGGVKYDLPHPTLCPDCRQQRRLAWRNERKLYHGTCDITGKKMISLYSPDKKLKVYHHQERRSDKWNELDYGRDFDFTQPFFPQFNELLQQVPRISTYNKRTENTEYGNNVIEDKDCYLLFVTFWNDHCYYAYTIGYCKNCIDCLWTVSCQNCYECTKVQNSYECFHCFNCQGCFNSQYLVDCFNTDSCAFCIGLRNKKYYFLNKSYSKSEYKDIAKKLDQDKGFLEQTKQDFARLRLNTPVNASIIENSENSSGDCLDNCKNCTHSFDSILIEDGRYCYDTMNASDNMDVYLGWSVFTNTTALLAYESENSFNSMAMYFCSSVAFHSDTVLYSDTCHSCKHCFGCVGMRHKEYCILNKQYTKEEYEKEVWRIIWRMRETGERWEFFPTEMSLHGYNETEAQTYYPLSKEEVESKWWKRHEELETKVSDAGQVVKASALPDIKNVTDEILDKVIICEVTGKPFKIIKQELEFYRKYNLPLPRRCFDQRHLDRMQLKTPRKLYKRTCAKCWVEIMTGFAPERTEIVYCQQCYYKEVYG